MRRIDASWAVRWGDYVPLSLSRSITRRRLVSFFYHTVSDAPMAHVRNLFVCKNAAQFEQDLILLKSRFQLPTHAEIAHRQNGRSASAAWSAAISFDDGLRECSDAVRPLLLKHGVPCMFFIITDAIDNRSLMFRNKVSLFLERWHALAPADRAARREKLGRRFEAPYRDDREFLGWIDRLPAQGVDDIDALCESLEIDLDGFLRDVRPYMTREQILQLHRDGFTIGAHTRAHPRLWELKDATEVEREIIESCAAVRDLTGQAKVPFAFPFNGLWMDRDRIDAIRKKTGFIDLFYDSNNLMRDRGSVVNRIWVDSPEGAAPGRSNLPRLLRRAHALEPFRAMKRMM